MDPISHIIGMAIIAAVIVGLGAGLTALHVFAMRIRLDNWPPPLLAVLAVGAPVLGWAGFGVYLLALMTVDPTAANLWPLTLGLLSIFWLIWMAVSAAVAAIIRFYLGRS